MKILHVITSLGSGGAERQLTALVRASHGAAWRHHVVSLMDDGTYGAELRAAGVPLDCLGLGRGAASLPALLKLVGLIRRSRPDLVQTWLYHADLAGLLAARLAGGWPVLWSLRCSDMRLDHYSRLTRWVVALLARLSSWPVAVVANSAAGLREHQALGYHPRRGLVIANGIDSATFHPDATAAARLRQELSLPAEAPLVGCVARHDPMKDHAGLLRAFAALPPPAVLLLIGKGTGPENPRLQAEIAAAGLDGRRVRGLGERRDVPRLVAGLDLFVLASAFGEGFPNALAEAMACAIPCLATDVGDSALLLQEGGRVVPPADPAALAEALRALLALSPAERHTLGQQGRQRIERQYSLPAMVAAYQTLYQELETP